MRATGRLLAIPVLEQQRQPRKVTLHKALHDARPAIVPEGARLRARARPIIEYVHVTEPPIARDHPHHLIFAERGRRGVERLPSRSDC